VTLTIGTLHIVTDSPLLDHKYDDAQVLHVNGYTIMMLQVFIQWELLDFDDEECQTDLSLYIPRTTEEDVDFHMRRGTHTHTHTHHITPEHNCPHYRHPSKRSTTIDVE
jgi:hypothetical protein